MENQSSTCGVCGCVLSPEEAVCPLCGTPAEQSSVDRGTAAIPEPPLAGSSADQAPANAPIQPMQRIILEDRRQPLPVYGAPSKANSARPRKRALRIAIVVGVLAIFGLGASIFGAWSGDQDLKRQADQASDDKGKLVETRPEYASGSGSSSGTLAGGGIAVPENDALYLGLSSGIGYQDSVSASEGGTFPLVSTDCALYLNLYDEELYYVVQSGSSVEDAFKGSSIRRTKDLHKTTGSPRGAEVLYRATDGEKITSLTIQNGWMYFMAEKDGSFALMEMPCDASSKPREISRREAEAVWVFTENGRLYVLSTTTSDWRLEARELNDEQAAFSVCMEGTGRLAVACLHEGALYYALEEGTGSSHLYRKTEQGEFEEYQDVANVVRLSASGDVVAAITQKGGLLWVDASTGIYHDISEAAELFLSGSDPRKLGLSAYDEWICVRDDKDGMIQYNVNSDTMWTYGSSAADPNSDRWSQGGPSEAPSETIMA